MSDGHVKALKAALIPSYGSGVATPKEGKTEASGGMDCQEEENKAPKPPHRSLPMRESSATGDPSGFQRAGGSTGMILLTGDYAHSEYQRVRTKLNKAFPGLNCSYSALSNSVRYRRVLLAGESTDFSRRTSNEVDEYSTSAPAEPKKGCLVRAGTSDSVCENDHARHAR
ncbi:hypothetical protein RF11_08441 [Thelohanellus kitauei]|uniref:Uncharacterized protein n=1 Tax=Thelohanellus kitauei TaxID=669202 RepID=A0A0C2J718_THEKT|nr:hypothetical protein RF11_08441 [Thelohanellus kitauei]